MDDGDQGIAHRIEQGFDPARTGTRTSFDSEYEVSVCIVDPEIAGSGEAESGLGYREIDRDLPHRREDGSIHDLRWNPSSEGEQRTKYDSFFGHAA